MFNITADALKWLFDHMRPRWLWGPALALGALFSLWTGIPEKYQTALLDYAVEQTAGKPQAIDLEIGSFAVDGPEDEFLIWLKSKIERNLVELFVEEGKRTAHPLAVLKPDSRPHPKIEGTLSPAAGSDIEVSARMVAADGAVLASTSFAAPRDFLKAKYKSLPATLVYGLDVGPQSLKPLATKARMTNSLTAYSLFTQAKTVAASQDFDMALQLLDKSVERDPGFATAHRAAGEILRAKGDEDGARVRELQADRINLDHPKVPILGGVAKPLPDSMAALAVAKWMDADPGLEIKRADVASYGIRLLAWRFDPRRYTISVAVQTSDQGTTARVLREKQNGILAVNGGFFDIDRSSRLTPSGALIAEGRRISDYREGAGSALLYEKDGRIAIGWSKEWSGLGNLANAVQAGPMIVDPGGKNGVYKNDFNRHNRTAVCIMEDDRVVIVVVTGGLSLFELGAILSARESDGGFACDRAMNLDGGPSTQASFRSPGGDQRFELEGLWPSQNAIIVKKRPS